MSTLILETPVAAQIFGVFLLGAILAAAANYCVDRFGGTPRYRSPWRRFPNEVDVPRRTFSDKIPIWGWIALSRFCFDNKKTSIKSNPSAVARRFAIPGWESRYFWVRPLFVEIFFATLLSWRYFELVGGAAANGEFGRALVFWGAETFLFWIALCASLVDFDDYIIPDALVLPGALVGLALAATFPFLSIFPFHWPLDGSGAATTNDVFLFAARAGSFFGLDATPKNVRILVFAGLAAIWTFWAFSLLDRRWYGRLGWRRASAIFCRRIRRSALTPFIAIIFILGLAGIAFVVGTDASATSIRSTFVADAALQGGNVVAFDKELTATGGLTNAFLGLFVGTALIWGVRVVGGGALGVEAMGFGDVVLLGTIGAFVGWEGVLVVFFVAPFFGLIFGVGRRLIDNAPEIPYGPFLCLGTVVYCVGRTRFHEFLAPFFNDPLFVAGLGTFGFVLLAAMLFALRVAKKWAGRA